MGSRLQRSRWILVVAAAGVLAWSAMAQPRPRDHTWRTLEPGLELGVFQAPRASIVGDGRITVLRVDPERLELVLGMETEHPDQAPRTALQWAQREDWVAAINASMFRTDHRTSTELLRELPLDLDRLQHAERGPEAQLAVQTAAGEREWVGSYETGFWESDDNREAWSIPNVVGVRRRPGGDADRHERAEDAGPGP